MLLEKSTVHEACIFFGGSEKLLSELCEKLQDWYKLQPHLPQDFSEKKMEWLIIQTKFSLEKAKQKLDMYYTIRSLVPEMYTDRDPRKLASALKSWQYVVLPNLTPEKCRLTCFRLTNPDPSLYNPCDVSKYIFMAADIQMNELDHSSANYIICDSSMFSLSHVLKITPVQVKKWDIIFTKAYAAHLKGIHMINAPPYVDRLVTMIKSIASKKLSERVHTHPAGNLESLYRFIPKSALPKDYGGEQPMLDELSAQWNDHVKGWRDWFLEQENVLVNERLRPGPALDKDSLFGFSGSFRKLDVD